MSYTYLPYLTVIGPSALEKIYMNLRSYGAADLSSGIEGSCSEHNGKCGV